MNFLKKDMRALRLLDSSSSPGHPCCFLLCWALSFLEGIEGTDNQERECPRISRIIKAQMITESSTKGKIILLESEWDSLPCSPAKGSFAKQSLQIIISNSVPREGKNSIKKT